MGLAYQITDNEIIVFGGKSAITFQIFNGCFVFDVEKMEIKERGSLVNPCSFMNTPLVFNNNLYAYGNDVYVHCYNIPEHKWSAIPKSSVVLPKSWAHAARWESYSQRLLVESYLRVDMLWADSFCKVEAARRQRSPLRGLTNI